MKLLQTLSEEARNAPPVVQEEQEPVYRSLHHRAIMEAHGEISLPDTLRDTVNSEIQNVHDVSPDWTKVSDLPDDIRALTRAIGEDVFKKITNTPIDDIETIIHRGTKGPNPKREIAAVAEWLHANGHKHHEFEERVKDALPNYEAEPHYYHAKGIGFLKIRDDAGEYVYAWPLADEKIAEK